jgi:hypothetical protein
MIAACGNAKALSTYMGHAGVAITYDRYGHLMPRNQAAAAGCWTLILSARPHGLRGRDLTTPNVARGDTCRMMREKSAPPDLVEFVRSQVAAVGSGDIDAMTSFLASDAVWDSSPMGIEVSEGRAAIHSHLEDWWDAYDASGAEAGEILDLGNGVSLAVKGRLIGSGGEVRTPQDRVGVRRRTGTRPLERVGQDGRSVARLPERLGGLPLRGGRVPRPRRRARARARPPQRAWQAERIGAWSDAGGGSKPVPHPAAAG